MFDLLLGIILFFISVLFVIDAFLPSLESTYKIDDHRIDREKFFPYELILIDGPVKSCKVGYKAFSSVKDGYSVFVEYSRIFRGCWKITFGDQVIYRYSYGRLVLIIIGVMAFAFARGWNTSDDY